MGVPAFFKWLSCRYPKAVIDALSEDELQHLLEDYKKEKKQSAPSGGGSDPNEISLNEDFDSVPERDAMIKLDI